MEEGAGFGTLKHNQREVITRPCDHDWLLSSKITTKSRFGESNLYIENTKVQEKLMGKQQ